MKNAITIALASIAVLLLLLKTCSGPAVVVKEVVKSDTVTLVRVDTIVIEKPVPVRVIEKRTDTLTVYRDETRYWYRYPSGNMPLGIRSTH